MVLTSRLSCCSVPNCFNRWTSKFDFFKSFDEPGSNAKVLGTLVKMAYCNGVVVVADGDVDGIG